jgi:hypothetical protein
MARLEPRLGHNHVDLREQGVQEYMILMNNPIRPRLPLSGLLVLAFLLGPKLALPAKRPETDSVAQLKKMAEADQVKLDGILSEPFWGGIAPIGELRKVERGNFGPHQNPALRQGIGALGI